LRNEEKTNMHTSPPVHMTRCLLATIFLTFLCSWTLAQNPLLFDNDELLELTLSFDRKALMKDRDVESEYHDAIITYQQGGEEVQIPLRIKTRGHFRKKSTNCKFPPIRLNFAKKDTPENSIFYGQDKTKLVTPCRDDEYVVCEYLVYKLYNLLTPKSFKARLVRVTYFDNIKEKTEGPYFGIILEEEEQMAKRNGMISIERLHIKPKYTRRHEFLQMAVFQYMIGNTDWSVQYLQNIKLITEDTTQLPYTVPYDFDHAGIVKAPYANPAPELLLSSTRERRYRGFCMKDMVPFQEIFKLFNEKKDEFYAVYTENPYLSESYVKRTLKFLDEFYETINDPEEAEVDFTYPCDPNGTGNVVIKGLRED